MTTDELIERVFAVIAVTAKIPRARITTDSSFEELGIDSLDGLNILFALEEEFDITIPDEARNIRDVRQVVAIIKRIAAEDKVEQKSGV